MNTISKEQKSNLAKLLATENLNVEHRKVKTAHFVPKTRTLCLPIWDNMSNDLYDLLCGHEVGHALWTPADETKLNEAKKKYNIPHSYMNVIEDIRIDKKMKLKYPGLRKSYFNGYKELVARDFFGKIGDEANNMRFIDRLNVFTKSGHLENTIEFNDQEKSFIEKSNHLETFDDVIDLAKQIFKYSGEENYDKEKDPLYKQLVEQEQDNLDQDEQDNQSEQSDSSDSQDPSDEKQSQSGGDKDTEKEEEKDNTTSGDDGNKTDEPENENKQKVDGNKGHMGGHNPEYQPEKITPSNSDGSLSDEMFKEAMKSLSNMSENTRDRKYVTLPKLNEEDVIVSSKHIAKLYKDFYTKKYSSTPTLMANSLNRFKEWKKSQSGTISYMAKEFEMKKAADNYKKSMTSKTGIINMNKIHSYKFNDDIFKKIQVEPGAKNHGMIMFIDWSGSMSQNIDDTIKQTLNLVMFCKAVQIPFRVFAFSDITRAAFYKKDADDDYGYSSRATRDLNNNPFKHKHGDLFIENVNLIEWLSSDQKTPEYNENMLNLYRFGEYHANYYNHRRHYDSYEEPIDMPSCMRLGGTPLDPAIVASLTIVKNFIAKHKISDISQLHESEIEEKRKSLVQTIGENIQLRRLITKDFSSDMNAGSYIHSDSKLGAVVVISGGDESLAKDIAMHVAAFNPLCLSESDLDPEILEREKAIYMVQAEESGKPKEIMEKMIEGKLKRFLSEVSLLSQDFVKDSEISIQELLDSKNAKIESYSRLKVGEGIEVESKSFADEVAEQLK